MCVVVALGVVAERETLSLAVAVTVGRCRRDLLRLGR
jgi:hypothetical protein